MRALGFINIVYLATALAFLRPRLPRREGAPIVEWRAFLEVPYTRMVTGMALTFGGLFFAFSSVSISSFVLGETADREQLGCYGHDIIGMSCSESLSLILVFNAVGIPARLLTGWIVDKYVDHSIV